MKKLKVIGRLGTENQKSLLCELPQEWVTQIQIDDDGTVNATDLLKICIKSEHDSNGTEQNTIDDAPYCAYEKIRLHCGYRKHPKNPDPRLNMQFPDDVYEDLEKLASFNRRTIKQEILARVIKTLELNQEFMATGRFMRLLFNNSLSYKHGHEIKRSVPRSISNKK